MKEIIERLAKEVAEQTEYSGIVGIHTGFVLGYKRCLEANQFIAADIIGFYDWMQQYQDLSCALRINEVESKEELIEIWKQQNSKNSNVLDLDEKYQVN